MEDGGHSLLEFARRAHKCIKKNKLDIEHWMKMCKILFIQMIECIEYIHNKNVIHFDISLENFLINDVNINVIETDHGDEKIEFCLNDNVQIKICDFGLAQYFQYDDFSSSKYCG